VVYRDIFGFKTEKKEDSKAGFFKSEGSNKALIIATAASN